MNRQEMLDQLLEIKSQRMNLPDKDMTFETYLDETIRIVSSDAPDSVASMALLDVIERTKAYMDKKEKIHDRKRRYHSIATNVWWTATLIESLLLLLVAYLYFFQRDIFNSLP